MAPSGQHLFSVAAFLLVFLVKEAECWTSTHSYVTVGGVSVVLIILIVIRICLRTQRCMSSQRRPARQLMVIPGNTQQRVIGTPSNTANPYNAGYDQTGTIGTMGIPPSYVRSVTGSTPDIHPHFANLVPAAPREFLQLMASVSSLPLLAIRCHQILPTLGTISHVKCRGVPGMSPTVRLSKTMYKFFAL